MNTRNAQLELMRRCLDSEATDEEFARLEQLLRNDPEFRKDYLRYVNVDLALAALPKSAKQPAGGRGQVPSQDSQIQDGGWQRFRGLAGWVSVALALLLLAGMLILSGDRWWVEMNHHLKWPVMMSRSRQTSTTVALPC